MLKKTIKFLYFKYKFNNSSLAFSSEISLDTKIGKKVKVLGSTRIGSSTIDDYSYIGDRSIIERTEINKFVSIATDLICGLGEHPTNFVSTYPGFYSPSSFGGHFFGHQKNYREYSKTIIGPDVWIGARVTILAGTNIGAGAIIAAGSVVTKNIPPYAIVAGVPAKIIKMRFDEITCSALLSSQWWNYSESKLKLLSPFMSSSDVFIQKVLINDAN